MKQEWINGILRWVDEDGVPLKDTCLLWSCPKHACGPHPSHDFAPGPFMTVRR